MLKVISGDHGGRNIIFKPSQKTRPTSQLVKESIFNIVQFEIVGATFLDLFFGSGQIGIEALSRGAKSVTFVDKDIYCKKCLINNLNNFKLDNKNLDNKNFEIFLMDANLYLLKSKKIFDIIFLDPPYNLGLTDKILKNIYFHIHKGSIVIVETEKNEELDKVYKNIKIFKQYIYGKKKITVYKYIL